MLLWMKLKNLALVSAAEIEFAPGFNVISGETGAGKSIIMGGVALLLGARADKSAIRTGTEKCEISAEFRIPAYARERIAQILNDADVEMEGVRVLLIAPMTMMNASGVCLREALSFYKIPPENLIVVYDDVNLDPGELRIRIKGSDGGHNGLKSIIYQLQSDNFPRIRIGVGKKPHPDYVLADWVLGTADAAARKAEAECDKRAYDALKLMVTGKTDLAMNRFNVKKKG